jgi:phosphatidate cytidylyltransferase
MSPILSPKKTIEGAVGGVLGAGLLGALYGLAARHLFAAEARTVWVFAIVCAVGGMISIVGDLGASAIKRNYDIKDYSNLIPGHGGILDRFDSIIFTAPIIYYLLVLVAGMR